MYEVRKLSHDEHPPLLREIPDPPEELWSAGSLPSGDTAILTVVGARRHSPYGEEAARRLVEGLRGHDVTIVSGLALGIDAIAHRAAISAGLRTVAVPGSGLDPKALYPRSNLSLATEILAHGGGMLSEFPPETKAEKWTFPKRNRIMAGMAHATLVIEAETRSGTLITSRLATDYNRDVLAVPGEIFSILSEGPNMLISLGATPIHRSEDILRALGFADEPHEDAMLDLSSFSPMERAVMESLTGVKYRETLIEELGLTPSEANILLMKMEISGHIEETAHGLRRKR